MTLTEDMTVNGVLTVASGATIDVAGHTLTVQGVGTGTGTVTSSAPGGVLNFNIPSGGSCVNSALTISGGSNMTVWKTGGGFLQMTKLNTGFGGNGVVSMIVKAGTVKKGADSGSDNPNGSNAAFCGAEYSTIVVKDGGQFDIGGRTCWNYDYVIEGDGPDGAAVRGALINTVRPSSTPWHWVGDRGFLRNITLSGDATISGGVASNGAAHLPLHYAGGGECDTVLDGHVLTVAGASGYIYIGNNRKFDDGEIYVKPGSLLNAYNGVNPNMGGIVLKIDGIYRNEANGFSPLKSLMFGATGVLRAENYLADNKLTVVRDTYAPNLSATSGSKIAHLKVQLGAEGYTATTLDLSLFADRTFDAGSLLTFHPGSSVTVKTGLRDDIEPGTKLVSWTAQPADTVSFTLQCDGTSAEDRHLEAIVKDDGLYLKSTLTPYYATRNVQEGKWEFFLEDGTVFPDEEWNEITADMEVRFSSYAEYQAIKALGVSPSRFLLTALSLPAGAEPAFYDMSSGMDFEVASGLTIDVCGNTLRLPPATVGGNTAFTVTSSAAGGVFDIWVDKGGTVQNKNVTISGGTNMTVWKTGEGFLQMLKLNTGFGGNGVVSMIVKAGTVKKGADSGGDNPNGSDAAFCGAQYSKIVVEDGGQFDIGGRTYWDYDYEIEGDGPDGATVRGALINTVRPNSLPWDYNGRGYLRNITFSGDATIGGTMKSDGTTPVHLPLHYKKDQPCDTFLNGHVLTIDGPGYIYIGKSRKFDDGEIYVEPGSLLNAYDGVNPNMGGIVLRIDGTFRTETHGFSPLKSLVFGGTGVLYAESDNNQLMVVRDTYAPNLSAQSGSKIAHPKVQLGAEGYTTPTLDLSLFENKTFASGDLTTFYAGSTVSVDLDGRTDLKTLAKSASPYLMTWSSSAKPSADTVFAPAGEAAKKRFRLKAEDAGLRILPPAGFIIIVR